MTQHIQTRDDYTRIDRLIDMHLVEDSPGNFFLDRGNLQYFANKVLEEFRPRTAQPVAQGEALEALNLLYAQVKGGIAFYRHEGHDVPSNLLQNLAWLNAIKAALSPQPVQMGEVDVEALKQTIKDRHFKHWAGDFSKETNGICCEVIDLAIDHLSSRGYLRTPAQEWRDDMENIPKDGRRIVVRSTWFHHVTGAEIEDYTVIRFTGVWRLDHGYGEFKDFEKTTHWMPIPAAPTQKADT